MIIFLRDIPVNTRLRDLYEFVSPVLNRFLFFRSGHVKKVSILSLKDNLTKSKEIHGLIHLDSDESGQRAIKHLQNKLLKKRTVQVREYFQRDWHNDRRQNHGQISQEIINQRIQDRRRSSLEVIEDISQKFTP